MELTLLAVLLFAAPPAGDAEEIRFSLAKPGNVSAAVYDAEGRLLRSLLHGKPLPAGEHRLNWDGLDALGQAVPAGQYEWRVLRNEGLQAEYLLNVGANPGWAPYGMWVGSHSTVSAAVLDAQRRLYVGGLTAENCPAFQCISLDGKTLHWQRFQFNPFKGAQRLAARDGLLFVLQQDAWLYAIDANDPNKQIGKWDVIHPNESRSNTRHGFLPHGHEPGGLAVHAKFIAVSHPAHNVIRWHEPETMKLLREETLPGVRGLAVAEDGSLIAVGQTQVWRIGFPSGKPEPLVRDDTLSAAAHVAVDEKRDELWIAESGESHTVRRYRYSTGERSLLLGAPGGRPFGRFDPLQWRDLMDITCDGKGGIITVEATPRRVAHFSVEGEKLRLINQWFGGQRWGNLTAMDPADPNVAYFVASSFHRGKARLDLRRRTWELEALYETPGWASRSEGKHFEDAPFPTLTHHDAQWQVMHRGERIYLVSAGGHSCDHAPAVIRVDTVRHRLVPVACAGVVRAIQGEWPAWFLRLKGDLPTPDKRNAALRFAYSWSDTNGDGELQNAEFRIREAPNVATLAHGCVDADWNVTLPAILTKGMANQPVGVELRNLAIGPDAAPEWDWAEAQPTVEKLPTELSSLDSVGVVAIHRDETGALTALVNANTNPTHDRQGDAWPGCTLGTARIVRFNAEGRHQWNAGKHGVVNDIPPGEFQEPQRVLGAGHGCVFIQDRVVRPGQAWTTDGLYAGSFLDRRADDGLPFDQVYRTSLGAGGPEMFLFDQIGGSVTTTRFGDVIWNPVGRNSSPLYRITGWDDWERESGRITLERTAPVALGNGTGLRGSYFANTSWRGTPVATRVDRELWFGNRTLPFTRDDSGRDWQDGESLRAFDLRAFSARWEGRIEARFGESYRLVLEYDEGSTARLWLDGQIIADSHPAAQSETAPARKRANGRAGAAQTISKTGRLITNPIPMTAGDRHRIAIEYASSGSESPHLHFEWESFTQERQHVPTSALTPL